MTQPTKPTLKEQIAYQDQLLQNYQVNPVVTLIAESIRASLRELQAIRSQPVPVEPNCLTEWRHNHDIDKPQAVLDYIDTLLSKLQTAQQEQDAKDRLLKDYEEWLSVQGEGSAELVKRAEQAEAALKVAQQNYQFMVNKAADKHLPAYRELGERCANLEQRAEQAEARNARMVELLKRMRIELWYCNDQLVRGNGWNSGATVTKALSDCDELLREVEK